MYLLKLALRPWKMAPLSQIFSSIAVGFLLLLMGFLFWMQYGLKSVLVRLQGEQVITAYLETSVKHSDESKILDSVRNYVGTSKSTEIKLVDSKLFIETLKPQYPDLVRELEDLGKDMEQVIPRYISISGLLPESALGDIKTIPGIESIESSKDRYQQIVGAFSTLRWVARVLMGGVCFALLTGLIHLSRTNYYLHSDALSILRFWGAGASVLAGPGTLSGFLVGLLGGLIASGGWMTIGVGLARHIRSLSGMLKTMPSLHSHLAISLLVIGCVIGFFSGLIGSLFSQTGQTANDGSMRA